MAVMSLTKLRPAVVEAESVSYKIGDAWVRQPLTTNQLTEFQSICVPAAEFRRDKEEHPLVGEIHVPIHSAWRLRLEVVEPRYGIRGLIERFKYPIGYYRMGGVLNVVFGSRPCRYTGQTYYVESEEIQK